MSLLKWFCSPGTRETQSLPKLEVTGPATLEIEDGKVLNLSDFAAVDVRLVRDGEVVAELDCLPAGHQWERDATGCTVRWSNCADSV